MPVAGARERDMWLVGDTGLFEFCLGRLDHRLRPLPTTRQSAARSEWRLITATHNLLKLHHHKTATAAA